ncbi:uncharacterized protein CCR75_007730 [Bremia lactucae]|uniref:Uncharacterized protein n=1 Tax=Bremia lactucae TaxID=4779 RepID=A0A976IJA2_BRELC|nr:hypothetical protein CCR75_007730 [Bremia lactucae]
MTSQGNSKGLDALGQEVLWSSSGQQVMMQWEKRYMETCVEALAIQPTDRVLEIGFGLAYSGSCIQRFRPRSHTIIECDRETLERTRKFAAKYNGVEVMAGTWQCILPTLDKFDCVFFDDYPLPELQQKKTSANVTAVPRQQSRWHDFLDVALKHCQDGARISGYLARSLDLERPGCSVKVSRVQVDVPEHCNYFPYKTALVPVITVMDPLAAARLPIAETGSFHSLPHFFMQFERACQYLSSSDRAKFSQWRERFCGIRKSLLEHKVDAHLHKDTNVKEECDAIDDDEKSSYYSSEAIRREFLRTLRSKAKSSITSA